MTNEMYNTKREHSITNKDVKRSNGVCCVLWCKRSVLSKCEGNFT